jgi:hypothetical protein
MNGPKKAIGLSFATFLLSAGMSPHRQTLPAEYGHGRTETNSPGYGAVPYQLHFAEEESPALLLLWTIEKAQWKVVAWAVEVP